MSRNEVKLELPEPYSRLNPQKPFGTPFHGRKTYTFIRGLVHPAQTVLDLPTEIWLDILSYVPEHSLDALSRTCNRLRWITLPLLFRSQLFFPFLETFTFRRLDTTFDEYQDRMTRRVSFMSSAQMAGIIQELHILYYGPGYNRRHNVTHTPIEAVFDALFSALPTFQHLTKLILQYPACNAALFGSLKQLQHLLSFELEVSSAASGTIPIPAQKEFILNRTYSPIKLFPSDEFSLYFLFPAKLEVIVAGFTGTETIARALNLAHDTGVPLSRLATLDLAVRFVASPHLHGALAACPNLTSLRLRSSALDGHVSPTPAPSHLPATLIPHLTSFHGPLDFALIFSPHRTLRALRLWSSHSVSSVSAPWLIHGILSQLPMSMGLRLTSLDLGVTLLPHSLFAAIRDAFPSLERLAVNAHLDSFHPGTVVRHTLHAPPSPASIPADAEFEPTGDNFPAEIYVNLRLPAGLRIHTLRLGTQLAGAPDIDTDTEADSPSNNSELATLWQSANEVMSAFPNGYDPTSWRRWLVDRPWYVVEWRRVEEEEVEEDGQGEEARNGKEDEEEDTEVVRGRICIEDFNEGCGSRRRGR
ncbi:ubiquitin family protein [Favolaschia claudopus]|uniref:Ubiquitin family protein n=1 Tax=Favolaschia claudopus TaxID=2862362 RepID=A0AAW0AG24_9AGAR